MAQLVRDEGVVLAREDHMETDIIATVLTKNHGKLRILAKGARRLTSPSGAVLDVANRVELIYYRRRELPLLREATLIRSFSHVREDLARLEAALRGLALARDVLPEGQPEPRAYPLVLSFLQTLEGGSPPAKVLFSFVLHLLSLLGYGPHLEGCVACGAKEELTWSGERGGLVCRKCGGEGEALAPDFWRYLLAFQKLPVWAAGRIAMKGEDLQRAWDLLQKFLSYQLGR